MAKVYEAKVLRIKGKGKRIVTRRRVRMQNRKERRMEIMEDTLQALAEWDDHPFRWMGEECLVGWSCWEFINGIE